MKRAKLYYLRDRKGKSARISEKIKKSIGIDVSEQTAENEAIKKEESENIKVESKKEYLEKGKGNKPKEELKTEKK